MWILGITSPLSLNSAAALLLDGKIIASAEEERFTRVKRAAGFIPHNSIEYVLNQANIRHDDIEKIAIGAEGPSNENELDRFCAISAACGSLTTVGAEKEKRTWKVTMMKQRKLMDYLNRNFEKSEIYFVTHHLAHAASACYVSGFKKSLFFTPDGRGEFESGLLGIFHDDEFEVVKRLHINESLGKMYSDFTTSLGWTRSLEEGKVMGLAPYGKPKESLEDIAIVKNDLKLKIDFEKIKSLKIESNGSDPTKDERKDIAATAQHLLEKCVLPQIDYLVSISGITNLCLAGGTALNIDLNGRILESTQIKNIFIQPASSDAGTALGAALFIHKQYSDKKIEKMEHPYLGPEYDDDKIKKDIVDSGLKYEELSNVAKEVAELISKNKVIGWMQGRAELGPRALGNRSLLANPTDPDMWKKVNSVKGRESWRPLAPSIMEENIDDFFVNHNSKSPFMLLKFQAKKEKISQIPAVVHVDGSSRPQTVSKKTNNLYWNLIKEFKKIQGVPLLLNTSLNLRGEPIVNNPQDALETLFLSNIDYVCIGKYLVSKN